MRIVHSKHSSKIRWAFFSTAILMLMTVCASYFPAIAESDSASSASKSQQPLRFTAELNLDRGCGAVYDGGSQAVAAYAVSHDAQIQITLQKVNEPEVILVNGLARGGQRYSFALPLSPAEGNRLLRLTAMSGGLLVIRDCSFAVRAQDAAPRQDKETDFDITGGGNCGTGIDRDDENDNWHPFRSKGQDKAVAVWNIGDCEFKVTWTDTDGQVAQRTVKPGKRTAFIGSKTLTRVIVHDCGNTPSEGKCKWGAKVR